MTEHTLITTVKANGSNLEGTINLMEFKCEGKYILAETDANYCPECGKEL